MSAKALYSPQSQTTGRAPLVVLEKGKFVECTISLFGNHEEKNWAPFQFRFWFEPRMLICFLDNWKFCYSSTKALAKQIKGTFKMSHALVFLHLLHNIYNSWSFTSALALLSSFFFSGPFVSSSVSILNNYAGAQNSGFHVLSRMAVLHIKSFAKNSASFYTSFRLAHPYLGFWFICSRHGIAT